MKRTLSVLLFTLVAVSAPAWAQDTAAVSLRHKQTVSANPFGLVFEWFNAEYERTLSQTTTWGVSGSVFDFDDFDYRNANGLLRFYPQGTALKGVFLGGRAGVYHVSNGNVADAEATFFGAGFEIGYNWLLGANQRVGLSIGAGANRLFGADLEGAPLAIPTVRLINVGVAF